MRAAFAPPLALPRAHPHCRSVQHATRKPLVLRRPVRAVVSELDTTAKEDVNSAPDSSVPVSGMFEENVSESCIRTMDDVHDIIALCNQFDVRDLRICDNGVSVEITRPGGLGFEEGKLNRPPPEAVPAGVAGDVVVQRRMEKPVEKKAVPAAAVAEVAEEEKDPDAIYDSDFVVTCNRVGFFFSGAKNKPPLVNVGDHVDFNQPVCIIEQLGQQYVYLSEASGTVLKVFVEDGDAVEYGQQVMVIRPD